MRRAWSPAPFRGNPDCIQSGQIPHEESGMHPLPGHSFIALCSTTGIRAGSTKHALRWGLMRQPSRCQWYRTPCGSAEPILPSQPQDLLLTLQSLPIRLQSWPEFRHQMLPVWIAEGLDQLRSEIAVSFFWGDASPPGLYGIRSILDSRDNSSFPVRCLLWCKH